MTTYTPAQLAKQLQVSRTKVMTWISSGKLTAVNVGEGDVPRYRITADAVETFLDRRQVKPSATKGPTRRITQRTAKDYFSTF
ncbi:MAG: helix-turn-helix domain-containing protein [Pirellulaceae bacterium]|nr:helix-turn-helix domain-containing protein [Pirellulaceae bacterium]HJN08180.1 helix-turn-helix domain-containing protein [Pirellulaceae bacterium]